MSSAGGGWSRTRALHRLLRFLLPADFRAQQGQAMEDLFAEAYGQARARGRRAVFRLWIREVVDLAKTGATLRPEAAAVDVRSVWRRTAHGGVRSLADDLVAAVQVLVRRPSTTLFAALTVALGVGSTTAIFGVIEGVVLHPLPYEGADRMVMLWQKIENGNLSTSPSPEQIEALSAQTDLVEATAPWGMDYKALTGLGNARTLDVALIRPSFHDLVGRPPLIGRAFTPDELAGEGARVVLLRHGLWRDSFGGDPGVIGRALTLDGAPWEIIGVMPPRTVLPGWGVVSADAWAPLSAQGTAGSSVVALLRPGATPAMVNERLAAAAPGADGTWDELFRAEVTAMRDLAGSSLVDTLTVLMVAVGLLLVIACVNVSNLLVTSATARARETAVRSALGAGRSRLVRQFLAESGLIALLGGLAGVALAWGGQRLMVALRPEALSALDTVELNGGVLTFALVLTAASGAAFGLVPALRASRPAALDPLRSGTRGGVDPSAGRFRWTLVSVQIALSFSLLVGALLVLDTLERLGRTDPGFDADRVLALHLELPDWKIGSPEERAAAYDGLAERLRALPGVERVAYGDPPSRPGLSVQPMWAEGEEPTDEMSVMYGVQAPAGFFETIGLRVLAGRAFTEEEGRLDRDVIVLSESTARRFFGESGAVGRRLHMGRDGTPHTVVGVVGDVAMTGLRAGPSQLQGYWPGGSADGRFVIRLAGSAEAEALMPLVRQVALATDEAAILDQLGLASDMLQSTLDRERFALSVIGAFALTALALAAVGLYGLLAQVVGQRVREIGVRVALGASRGSVQALVLRRAAGATVLGLVFGAGLAALGVALLESQLFGVAGDRPRVYALAAAVLAGTALLAGYVPARRASTVDPVSAMRVE